jgi:hypothetical protein
MTTAVASPYLTLDEAADYCRLAPKTLNTWRSLGWVQSMPGTGKLLFHREELDRALAAPRPGRAAPTAPPVPTTPAAGPRRLPIAHSEYGTVDIRRGVPAGYAHLPGPQAAERCRRRGVAHAPALVGWEQGRWRRSVRPVLDGVVVAAGDAQRA